MKPNSKREQKLGYLDLVQAVTRILYDEDPYGMGSSVFAPLDEYSDIAAEIVREISKLKNRNEVEMYMQARFGANWDRLSSQLVAVWSFARRDE